MMKLAPVCALLALFVGVGLHAESNTITATNYAAGFFGVVADEKGQPLESGSVIHLILDAAGDGRDDPAENGAPTDDDVLLGTCQVGISGGAPSDGTFILSCSVTEAEGSCYLRAFHSTYPQAGTYYCESVAFYPLPDAVDPFIYGIEFPNTMTESLGESPELSVILKPSNLPVNFAKNGGYFAYLATIRNNTQRPQNFDVWVDLILPGGEVYGPILLRTDNTLAPGGLVARRLRQLVPQGAPQGLYSYVFKCGDYRNQRVIHEEGLPLEKTEGSLSVSGPSTEHEWEVSGWEGDNFARGAVPDFFFLDPPYPNPFNQRAQLQFGLPEAASVRIDVYNILGSRVTTLVDQEMSAGFHHVVWDAQRVTSGLYIVEMKAGGYVHSKKAFLLK